MTGRRRPGASAVDERARDLERDVRLESARLDLAHRGIDVPLREGAAAGELVEYAGELLGKASNMGLLLWDE